MVGEPSRPCERRNDPVSSRCGRGGGDNLAGLGYHPAVLSFYEVAHHHATPHGVLTAVNIPDSANPVPEDVLACLLPEEVTVARTLRGYRQSQFVGGRLAIRQALAQLGVRAGPILPDDRGAPTSPEGLTISISHKRDLAVAMVARVEDGTLGMDIEDYGPPRPQIASHILTPAELELVDQLPEARRWIAILLRFSIKESVYKALDPYVRRYVGFKEAEVMPDLQGRALVTLNLAQSEGPFLIDARYDWLQGRLLTSVRIRPAPPNAVSTTD